MFHCHCACLSAGGDRCARVYVAPGGPALLQLSDAEVALCPGNCGFEWKKNGSRRLAKIKDGVEVRRCRPNCQMFPNGSLELSEVTPEDTGDYSVLVTLRNGTTFSRCFRLQVQEPVSIPAVNYTCRPNASVQLSCSVENGTDPTYSWSLDETPLWTPTKETMRGYQSVLRNVTCSARNEISEQRSDPTDIICPDPVSVPEVAFKCRSKGTVQLFCRVANGTDLSFSWTVNGTEEDNGTSSVEIPIGNEFIEVTCTARNQISESASNRTNVTCMVPVSEPEVEATCPPNGTVRLICVLVNGTAPSYSWSVNGSQQNSSGQELTIDAAVLLNVTCTASNMISQRESKPVNITCTVAVSEPEVEATCPPNGTVRLSCLLANGTAPLFSWSVNGTQQNASGQELTIDAAVLLNATCTASNLISQRESKPVNVTCTETTTAITTDVTATMTTKPTENSTAYAGRGPCMSRYHCILWSALGGAGALVVTALPLLIGCLYTMPRETPL
ncbi:cell adhesion molecule CEACAM5-like [Lissotriton helveticus]